MPGRQIDGLICRRLGALLCCRSGHRDGRSPSPLSLGSTREHDPQANLQVSL